MRKFALVLSGGGFKGAFQVGALRHLKAHWGEVMDDGSTMRFHVVAGVSVGALNGALTASDAFEELERLWLMIGSDVENVYTSDFIDTKNQSDKVRVKIDLKTIREKFIPEVDLRIGLWKGLGLALSRSRREKFIAALLEKAQRDLTFNFQNFKAIADNAPLDGWVRNVIERDRIKSTVFKCGFVSLNDGKYYSVRHTDFASDDDFRNAILASTAMPIVWKPVDKVTVREDGRDRVINQCVDGGIQNVSPLADVISEINDDDPKNDYTIVIINCSSGDVTFDRFEHANIAGIALRALNDIAITEIFNNDISEFLRINDIIDQCRLASPGLLIRNYHIKNGRTEKILRPFKAIVIQPDAGVLGDPLVAGAGLNDRRMLHGEQKAAMALRALRERREGKDWVVV